MTVSAIYCVCTIVYCSLRLLYETLIVMYIAAVAYEACSYICIWLYCMAMGHVHSSSFAITCNIFCINAHYTHTALYSIAYAQLQNCYIVIGS